MGWIALLGINEIATALPLGAIIWLALGGLFFTVGAVVYSFKLMNYKREFSAFMKCGISLLYLGSLCHFI